MKKFMVCGMPVRVWRLRRKDTGEHCTVYAHYAASGKDIRHAVLRMGGPDVETCLVHPHPVEGTYLAGAGEKGSLNWRG